MELRKDLELVEVEYNNEGKKAVMTFFDEERGEVLEVNFNRQSYDPTINKYVDDEEKAEKVDEWCKDYFDTTFEKLPTKIGTRKDIYHYDRFNSLWESNTIAKFDKEDKGLIFETEIKEIIDDGIRIKILFDYDGDTYASNMNYSDYIESLEKYFVNPNKQLKQYEKFKSKFGVEVADADQLIGKPIMVEVQVAFNKFPYAEIKKPNWK